MAGQLILLPQWNTAACTLCDFLSPASSKALAGLLDHYYATHAQETP